MGDAEVQHIRHIKCNFFTLYFRIYMYVSTLPSEGNSVGISQSIFPEALISTYNMLQLYS